MQTKIMDVLLIPKYAFVCFSVILAILFPENSRQVPFSGAYLEPIWASAMDFFKEAVNYFRKRAAPQVFH